MSEAAYWNTARECLIKSKIEPWLPTLAMSRLCQPLSSAKAERVFSFLTKMDHPSRRSMGDIHLKHYLFIVGNAEVSEELVKLEAQAIKMEDHKRSCDALLKGPRSGEKRRLTDAAFEEATATVIANDANE